MKTQLSTSVPPAVKQAYTRLGEETGVSLTDLLTAAVPLLEWHYRLAGMVAGYIQLDRPGDLDASAPCPECGQPFGDLPWIAVLGNGSTTCAPICTRCATSE